MSEKCIAGCYCEDHIKFMCDQAGAMNSIDQLIFAQRETRGMIERLVTIEEHHEMQYKTLEEIKKYLARLRNEVELLKRRMDKVYFLGSILAGVLTFGISFLSIWYH